MEERKTLEKVINSGIVYDSDAGITAKELHIICHPRKDPSNPNHESHLDLNVVFDFEDYKGTKEIRRKLIMKDYSDDSDAKKAFYSLLDAVENKNYEMYLSTYDHHCSFELLCSVKNKDSSNKDE